MLLAIESARKDDTTGGGVRVQPGTDTPHITVEPKHSTVTPRPRTQSHQWLQCYRSGARQTGRRPSFHWSSKSQPRPWRRATQSSHSRSAQLNPCTGVPSRVPRERPSRGALRPRGAAKVIKELCRKPIRIHSAKFAAT